jgi:uncharacterized membrane protein YqjE
VAPPLHLSGREPVMSEYESIPQLIKSLFADMRELIHEEIALARAEIREELSSLKTVAFSFGCAAVAAILGVVLLCIGVAGAIAYALGWPAWAGYGITAVALLLVAFCLVLYGQSLLTDVRALPETTASVKENLTWMQNKSVGR